MERRWWLSVFGALVFVLVIFMAGFYSGSSITGSFFHQRLFGISKTTTESTTTTVIPTTTTNPRVAFGRTRQEALNSVISKKVQYQGKCSPALDPNCPLRRSDGTCVEIDPSNATSASCFIFTTSRGMFCCGEDQAAGRSFCVAM